MVVISTHTGKTCLYGWLCRVLGFPPPRPHCSGSCGHYTAIIAFVSSHLHLLHDLLPEGAHLGGAGDGHVLGALVLAGDAVECRGVLLHVVAQVRLEAA